jgi:voltage-gated potassium channel Kch
MAVETATELAIFFAVDDFGSAATYTPAGGGGGGGGGGPGPGPGAGQAVTINGIFDNPQASRNATDMLDITIPAPQFVCRTSDVPNVAEGDSLVIGGVSYIIRVTLTDGTGVSTLLLERS